MSDLVGNPEDRSSHGATQYNRMVFRQNWGAQSVARLASDQLDTSAVQVRNPMATLTIFEEKMFNCPKVVCINGLTVTFRSARVVVVSERRELPLLTPTTRQSVSKKQKLLRLK